MANTPTYLLDDGTIISFKIVGPKKTAIGTKNNIEVYIGSPSFSSSYPKLAEEAAFALNTIIVKEIESPTDKEPPSVEEPIKYKIQGKITSDPGGDPIVGAKVKDSLKNKKVKTEETGDFTLEGEYMKDTQFTIEVSAKGYDQVSKTPFNQDNTLKRNVGIIILKSNKQNLKEEKRKELLLPEPQVKLIKLSKTDMEMAKQQAMNKLMTTIKTVLIPTVLTQLAAFGISKASEAIGKKFSDLDTTCPANIDELNKLIAKKNRLVKQLNNIYKTLTTIEVAVKTIDGLITAASIVVKTIKLIATLYPAIPFSPNPTKIATIQGGPLDIVEKKLTKYKIVSSVTVIILAILIAALKYVLDLLALLDSLIQGCAKEIADSGENNLISCILPDGSVQQMTRVDCLAAQGIMDTGGISEGDIGAGEVSEIEGIGGSSNSQLLAQEQISQELLDSTKIQSQQLSPVVTNVNGFDMDVEAEVTDNPLKRRRAIAKNTEGVIVLTGEYSYSSNDQILIDELVFYIQINNLKAE